MNGWTTTKVWKIDGHMYIAKSVEDAIKLYRLFMGKENSFREPNMVENFTYGNEAIIKENDK